MPSTNPHTIDATAASHAPNPFRFTFGHATSPAGVHIAADGVSLLEDGRRITPVMGEFHYARYPNAGWREELLKIRAGGIDIVATYVFWIFHEETEGAFDWTGDRDLTAFVRACGEVGLRCVVRVGPWCHGEVRNGGLPEWLLDKPLTPRTDDPAYLALACRFFAQIASRLDGLLWKDGGPVVGVQIENEFGGDPQHLLTLKQIAIDLGLDVPIYTRTGWPELRSPMPFGHMLPLFGGYAEGFWDRELASMPGHYWKEFVFKRVRTDAAIASEHFGIRDVQDASDTTRYPYLTCEIGPGMMCSYHRRITVFPMDVVAMVIVKIGSGSNSPGYYMYHGGTNPTGREPWLQEHQATRFTNWNDMPVRSYDFQTCVGEFGQIREQYHLLRILHLFLQQFGDRLAPLPSVIPSATINKTDTSTLRYALRTDGRRGFVFVNNYHRLSDMPTHEGTQFKIRLHSGDLTFPQTPTTIATGQAFHWPFNFDLGDGIRIDYATAQLVTQIENGDTTCTIFVETGNPAEFSFTQPGRPPRIVRPQPGLSPIATLTADNGREHEVLLLDQATAKTLYRSRFGGRDRLVLSAASIVFDHDQIRLAFSTGQGGPLHMLPGVSPIRCDGVDIAAQTDGIFARFDLPAVGIEAATPSVAQIRTAGPPREIPLGDKGVAASPADPDFDHAAVWAITIPPAEADVSRLLRIHYAGDVARIYAGERLLTDNFYNGTPFEISLDRITESERAAGLTLKILPLRADAPIHLLDRVRPTFDGRTSVVSLDRIEIVASHTRVITIA